MLRFWGSALPWPRFHCSTAKPPASVLPGSGCGATPSAGPCVCSRGGDAAVYHEGWHLLQSARRLLEHEQAGLGDEERSAAALHQGWAGGSTKGISACLWRCHCLQATPCFRARCLCNGWRCQPGGLAGRAYARRAAPLCTTTCAGLRMRRSRHRARGEGAFFRPFRAWSEPPVKCRVRVAQPLHAPPKASLRACRLHAGARLTARHVPGPPAAASTPAANSYSGAQRKTEAGRYPRHTAPERQTHRRCCPCMASAASRPQAAAAAAVAGMAASQNANASVVIFHCSRRLSPLRLCLHLHRNQLTREHGARSDHSR